MLNFRNTLIFFLVILLILLLADTMLDISLWIYAGIILVPLIIIAWGTKTIQSDFYLKSYCSGSRGRNEIAITFDDGPDAQVTTMILDILKENDVKAAFFIIGSKASLHPEILERIDEEGHIIGGHSFTHHFFFDLFSSSTMKNEMRQTENIVLETIGKKMRLFRPPYGVINPPLAKAIRRMQYISIGWSLKSNDTVLENDSVILRNIARKLRNGDILLFHDNKPWTVNLLKKLLKYINDHNFKVTRVDQLLNIQAYVN
jgi:peptidoglycan-N-acetylglucosamine deacetylase